MQPTVKHGGGDSGGFSHGFMGSMEPPFQRDMLIEAEVGHRSIAAMIYESQQQSSSAPRSV